MERSADRLLSTQPYLQVAKGSWRDYIEVTKPGIIKSNLLATFTGFFLASNLASFDWLLLFFTLAGTAFVIAGGCALNNFYDRDIDPFMERTQSRAVAEGRIKPVVALWYGIILTVIGALFFIFGVNGKALFLAFVGFFVYVFIYTMWLKRTSTTNTVIGGISGAVPPMIGWVAVTNSFDLAAWALFLILFCWQPPHFFALAMRKVEDYRSAGIPMLPVVKGSKETKKQTFIFTVLLLPASILIYFTGAVSWIYLVVAILLGGFYIYLAFQGFYTKDDQEWSRKMFVYSLIYLTGILVTMILDAAIRGWIQ